MALHMLAQLALPPTCAGGPALAVLVAFRAELVGVLRISRVGYATWLRNVTMKETLAPA
jgi:hypothetical protein